MQPERQSDGHVILCLNCGSSSLKFALYRLSGLDEPGSPTGRWSVSACQTDTFGFRTLTIKSWFG